MRIPIVRNVLEANAKEADELRTYFSRHGIFALNLISSPGSGKTSLLECTLQDLGGVLNIAVIEGDLQTDNDARRIAATGAATVQINTEGGCHLNSHLVAEALTRLDLADLDVLFIENVGNLVCPVEFDCGEDAIVAILSVAEGDDKPEKYPALFERAQVLVINKTDLLPYVAFDLVTAVRHARRLQAGLPVFPVSCTARTGLEAWYDWLRAAVRRKKHCFRMF